MEHYEKGEVHQRDDAIPIDFVENCVHMKVSYGSKVKNLIGFAFKKVKEPGITQISWTGHGKAFQKTISCAQIFKTKMKGLHRIENVRYLRTEEYWEPKIEGLDRLKVNIDVPAVTILFSKVPVKQDESISAPKELEVLLQKALRDSQHRKQRQIDNDKKLHRNSHKSESSQKQGESTKNIDKSALKKSNGASISGKSDREVTKRHSERSTRHMRDDRQTESNDVTPRKSHSRSQRGRTARINENRSFHSSDKMNFHNVQQNNESEISNNNDTKQCHNSEKDETYPSTTKQLNKKQSTTPQKKISEANHRRSRHQRSVKYCDGSLSHSSKSSINNNTTDIQNRPSVVKTV